MAVAFIGLMTGVLFVNLLVSNLFMESFYSHQLRKTLISAYEQIDTHIQEGVIDYDYFNSSFIKLCNSNNMNVVVVDEDYNMVIGNSSLIAARIWGYNVKGDVKDAHILGRTEHYILQRKVDPAVNMGFLELWGTLSAGYHFLLRIPLTSISASAKVSSRFIMYTNLVAILICAFLIFYLSGQIARPIRELTELSRRMANLDFDARYSSGGENEIGQLGEHFNQMSEKLEQTISQLKSANVELQKDIEKKTRIDEMRREFLSNVSHELKTPLALIQGYAEGLKDGIIDDPESREYYCDVIIDEASKMNNMVRQLMTLNQLEFGSEQLQMTRFDLAQLIEGKLAATSILAQQKQASLSYEGKKQVHVWGDEFKIEEVLTNYLSNALNHVSKERRIIVRLEERAGENGKPGIARVTVFNTGDPIPEESLDKLWIKFYKVDKARTREYGGSGVGLSIVKAIMDSHRQNYGVENVPGGVSFWFELEMAEGEA